MNRRTGSGQIIGRALATLAILAMIAVAPGAHADDAAEWLGRAAAAARQLDYVGTIVYQHGGHIETSRLTHLNVAGSEFEKLVNLEGPPREVIRRDDEVRCYYPDAKVVRIEPRTFRNAFPSLSAQQQKALGEFYEFRKAETGRVAGLETQAWVFGRRTECAMATSSGRMPPPGSWWPGCSTKPTRWSSRSCSRTSRSGPGSTPSR
jgi:sigma-E factor negative regulatory protein RseB